MIKRLWCASCYSMAGLHDAWQRQWAFRAEILLGILVLPLAFIFGHTALERLLLILSWLFIIVVELLNSAIETAIDRISLERHPLSGKAKDLGSAAVLIACLMAVATWLVIVFN